MKPLLIFVLMSYGIAAIAIGLSCFLIGVKAALLLFGLTDILIGSAFLYVAATKL